MSEIAVVFDMDGVLWLGGPHAPILGASDALQSLDKENV
jgi:ribonucleotide monophosphatase NagD (HAD superfamily)